MNIFKQINDALKSAGIPAMGIDKAAMVMAVVYAHEDEERFVYNPKLRADVCYIQERYHIMGGETPDREFVELFKYYVGEYEAHSKVGRKPRWAVVLFRDKYGVEL